jgi:fumarate hydratase class II
MRYRIERDSIGEIKVPLNKLWGAQTQRSLNNFQIGPAASMPDEIIHAYGIIKKAVAITNYNYGLISVKKKELITKVCDEIINGELKAHFPLVIWQTGSGTHTNMNWQRGYCQSGRSTNK